MNCEEFQECLLDYLRGMLEPTKEAAARNHVQRCLACSGVLEEITPVSKRLLNASWEAQLSSSPKQIAENVLRQIKRDVDDRSSSDLVSASGSSSEAQTQLHQLLMVQRSSQRPFPTVFTPAVSDAGHHGLLVSASGLPSGEFDLQGVFKDGTVIRRQTLATLRIPIELTDVRMTTDALAGATEDTESSSTKSPYTGFRERLQSTDSGARLSGLEGYIVPQVTGAAVELFLPLPKAEVPNS